MHQKPSTHFVRAAMRVVRWRLPTRRVEALAIPVELCERLNSQPPRAPGFRFRPPEKACAGAHVPSRDGRLEPAGRPSYGSTISFPLGGFQSEIPSAGQNEWQAVGDARIPID